MYRLDLSEYPAALMERLDRDAEEPLREQMKRPGGSVFPKIDALMSLGKYQDALGFVIDPQAVSHYRSYTDLLLCELFPDYAESCAAYYKTDGVPQLKDTRTTEQSQRCEQAMLCLLGLALIIREDFPSDDIECPVRWSTLIETIRDIASQAPRPTPPKPQ